MPKQNKIPTQQQIRLLHLREIYLTVLYRGSASRTDLKQKLGLSAPSISALVDTLLQQNILYETDAHSTVTRGRPVTQLGVVPESYAVPVVEMTRSGYQAVLYNGCAQPIDARFLPFPENAPSAIARLCSPLQEWLSHCRRYTIAVLLLVFPGSQRADGTLRSTPLALQTPPAFLDTLTKVTGLRVLLENTSDCNAYAEKRSQQLPEDYIFLHVGEGVGAGIIRSGKLLKINGHRPGEIGHVSIDYRGRPCSCGRKGCLERYISISNIAHDGAVFTGSIADFTGLCTLYQAKNPSVTAFLEEKAGVLAIGLQTLLSIYPASHVVLGGGIEQLGNTFLQAVYRSLEMSDPPKLTWTAGSPQNTAVGALWNYLDNHLRMEDILKE